MCLICVEFFKNRMTVEEVKRALPEMVMFANNEEERAHYKKLQTLSTKEELEEEAKKPENQKK